MRVQRLTWINSKFALADEGNPEIAKILEQFGFVRGVGYVQNFAKTGEMSNMQKAADAFGSFAEKYPENENAVSAMQQRTTCLRALAGTDPSKWLEAAAVIETLLDEKQPFKKKIVKRSEVDESILWQSSRAITSLKTGLKESVPLPTY